MKPKVKYLYALNENNELIEIKDAHELGGAYHCPECGQQMICKCGAKNAWHFAHEKVECDYNHYLHTIAEQRILEWFNAAFEAKGSLNSWEERVREGIAVVFFVFLVFGFRGKASEESEYSVV